MLHPVEIIASYDMTLLMQIAAMQYIRERVTRAAADSMLLFATSY
jgi:hypothetical protein